MTREVLARSLGGVKRVVLVLMSVVLAAALLAACGDQAGQEQFGTRIGHDWVRIQEAFVKRPRTVPWMFSLATSFNFWLEGIAHGKDAPVDVQAAGFKRDPAPSEPLSPEARRAAAAVAIAYLEHHSVPKYGSLTGGYLIAFREQKLEYRCKSPRHPPAYRCNGAHWEGWQSGLLLGSSALIP